MQFLYTIHEDEDFTPWGDPEIVAEATSKIVKGEWTPYVVTVYANGPVPSSAELTGCVVPTTITGQFIESVQIQDAHLREVAEDLARQIEDGYLDKLTAARDAINAVIAQMGGV